MEILQHNDLSCCFPTQNRFCCCCFHVVLRMNNTLFWFGAGLQTPLQLHWWQGHFSAVCAALGRADPLSQSLFRDVFLPLKLADDHFQNSSLDWDHHLPLQCYFMPKFLIFSVFPAAVLSGQAASSKSHPLQDFPHVPIVLLGFCQSWGESYSDLWWFGRDQHLSPSCANLSQQQQQLCLGMEQFPIPRFCWIPAAGIARDQPSPAH